MGIFKARAQSSIGVPVLFQAVRVFHYSDFSYSRKGEIPGHRHELVTRPQSKEQIKMQLVNYQAFVFCWFVLFLFWLHQDSGMEDISDGEDDLSDFEFDLDDYSPHSFFNEVEVSKILYS